VSGNAANSFEVHMPLLMDGQDRGQMIKPPSPSTIEENGWVLVSAEERAATAPNTFLIPPRTMRESLSPGDGAKLLFDIETREGGRIIDRGVHRMWVVVKSRTAEGYIGVLDNDPGAAENLTLREGDSVIFGPEHVADIGQPPRDYIVEKYGAYFFED
jgi:hypothetical protein